METLEETAEAQIVCKSTHSLPMPTFEILPNEIYNPRVLFVLVEFCIQPVFCVLWIFQLQVLYYPFSFDFRVSFDRIRKGRGC